MNKTDMLMVLHVAASYVVTPWRETEYKYKDSKRILDKKMFLLAKTHGIVVYDREYAALTKTYHE